MSTAAVIFDCDGVLVDSEPLANRILSELLGEHGVTMSPEECRDTFVGLNPRGVANRLRELRGIDLSGPLIAEGSKRFMEALERSGLEPFEGVGTAIEALLRRGVRLAAASNSPIDELRLKLRLSGLDRWFGSHAYSGDALGQSKPDPAVYLYTAARLGVEPHRCVVIEDTVTGVTAGVRAGMRVLGFTGTHQVAAYGLRLMDAGAARVFGAMAELEPLIG
ncbi:FMN hydrolase / 5-amino-6-(5-phospho-D-ribitylamino)uracil phosphatase [Phycisphaerales bacterium]|nr:FMN hydrolase / 5-amino-6-(5-phospho-D-ribitylamino)uracil phosphatase [Phycisphaerales bacterium]